MKGKTKLIFSLCFILAFAMLSTACDFSGGKTDTPTSDISAEKVAATEYLSTAWALFSEDEIKDYLATYESIKNDIDSAISKEDIDACKKRIAVLKNDIQKDIEYKAAYLSKPTALSDMKATFIKSVDDTWTELKTTYGTAVSSFENSVTTLKSAVNAAPNESTLSDCVTTWVATLSSLKTVAGIEVSLNLDGVKVQVLTDTAIAWQSKTEDSDLTGSLSAYFSIKYAKISTSMNQAKTQAELDKLKADFDALIKEYDKAVSDGTVQDVETMKIVACYAMTETWEELIKTYGEDKLIDFHREYISIRSTVKTVTNMEQVQDYVRDFQSLLLTIDDALNKTDFSLEEYKTEQKNKLSDGWQSTLKNYSDKVTAAHKTEYDAIIKNIDAATTKADVDKATAAFSQ